MKHSESIQNIAKALVIFHDKVGKVAKDAENPHFKKKYAGLPNVLETIAQPLKESGLIFSQFPEENNNLTTVLMHPESGEYMMASYNCQPEPEYTKERDKQGVVVFRSAPFINPQAIGSAIIYARRYVLVSILGLNIDEDDDGNKASGKGQQPQPPQQQPAPPQQPPAPPEKPVPNGQQFQALIDRVTKGEQGVLEKAKKTFKFTKVQVESIQAAILIANSNLPK